MNSNSLMEIQKYGKLILKNNNKADYAYEVDLFLMHLLKCSKVDLILFENKILSDEEISIFNSFIDDRIKNKPFQYIVGQCEFMGIDFFVGEGVLVPRSDTEILVETIINISKSENLKTGIDLCTGSGCISISLNKLENIKMIGVDISSDALNYAIKNNKHNNCNVEFLLGDLFESIPLNTKDELDFIVSNPPYIKTAETENLMSEVRDYEPDLALNGGLNGLDFYEEITRKSVDWLSDGGWLFFEIGHDQAKDVSTIMKANRFEVFDVVKDHGGNDRVLYGKLCKLI